MLGCQRGSVLIASLQRTYTVINLRQPAWPPDGLGFRRRPLEHLRLPVQPPEGFCPCRRLTEGFHLCRCPQPWGSRVHLSSVPQSLSSSVICSRALQSPVPAYLLWSLRPPWVDFCSVCFGHLGSVPCDSLMSFTCFPALVSPVSCYLVTLCI